MRREILRAAKGLVKGKIIELDELETLGLRIHENAPKRSHDDRANTRSELERDNCDTKSNKSCDFAASDFVRVRGGAVAFQRRVGGIDWV